MAELKPKLKVDVNHNPTKKGIKVHYWLLNSNFRY